jgi:hypothetical protein
MTVLDGEKLKRDFLNELRKEEIKKSYEEECKKKHKEKMKEIAYAIKNLLENNKYKGNNFYSDVTIYFNNCRLFDDGRIEENIDVRDYLEYGNPDTLSVVFEGPLYSVMNYDFGHPIVKKLDDLLKSYGYYFDLGYAWSFSIYEI